MWKKFIFFGELFIQNNLIFLSALIFEFRTCNKIILEHHEIFSKFFLNASVVKLSPSKMHRAYQPITAANNKLLKKRWDQRSYDLHRSKVSRHTRTVHPFWRPNNWVFQVLTSQAVIDNRPPDTYMHIHLKLKKLQVEEERLAVVERDNRILLEKMSWIMRTKKGF